MDQFKRYLHNISPIDQDAWLDFKKLLQPKELGKHEFLIQEGSPVHHGYLLLEGVIRVFFNKDGNEYNKTFFVPGMFPTPLTALLSRSPCALSFQALTPCRLLRFSYPQFRMLFARHRCLETLMLSILEQEWIKKESHDIRMVTNDATTNYLIFRKTYPDLEKLIPQYHIASYLGITPIQLSRIRNQLASKSG